MEYKLVVYHCRIGGIIELRPGTLTAGLILPASAPSITSTTELYLACLEPIVPVPVKEEEKKEESKESKED